ncbi:transient receptor potential cation channel subfamily M member 2-like isoform X2 [Rhopilema esculentum]|uniref:transient receptor potential cation channel subfamily M member 2-like isoform X2 n=1 Tax=Rhopilema esculentum TaxID=499914 RepID=UPI0031E2E15F
MPQNTENTKTSSFAKVNDAFQMESLRNKIRQRTSICQEFEEFDKQVSEKVREIWGTGVQPSLWLTLFGKGDKGLRIQAYDAIKEAVSKITSKSHTQFVLNASSCELRSLIREVRDESLSFCRIDWLTKCIIVSSEEQDNQKNEPGSKEDLNLQIDGKQYKSCIDFMANSALRKRDDKANNIFKEVIFLDILLCDDVKTSKEIFETFSRISKDFLKPTLIINTGCKDRNQLASPLHAANTTVFLPVEPELLNAFKANMDECQNPIFAVNVKDSTSDLYSLMKETILKGSKSLQLFETYQLIFWLIECGYRQQVLDIMMKKGYENAFAFVMDKYLTTQNSTKIGSLLKNYRFNLDAYVTKREKDIFDEGKHFNYDLHRSPSKVYTSLIKKNGDEEMLKNALLLLTDENLNFNREQMSSLEQMMISRALAIQPDQAFVFWKHEELHPLSNALMMRNLLKGIIDSQIYEEEGIPKKLAESVILFETVCLDLLDIYHDTSKEHTMQSIENTYPVWGNRSLLEIAGDTDFKGFVAHQATQVVTSKMWNGKDQMHSSMLSPITKFYLHTAMHILSFVMMLFVVVDEKHNAHNYIIWLTFTIVTSLLVDEIRQLLGRNKTMWACTKKYFSQVWNILDIVTIFLFYLGFGIHFFHIVAADIHLSLFALLWCLKTGQYLRVSRSYGPFVIMVLKMLVRCKHFIVTSFILVVGYGVFVTSLLYPFSNLADPKVYLRIMFRPVMIFFGELGIASYDLLDSKTVFDTAKVPIAAEVVSIIGMIGFLLLTNVLLMNILIADFNNIYVEITERARMHCAFEEYELLVEFTHKPSFPFPFSLPESVYLIARRILGSYKSIDRASSYQVPEQLVKFEKYCMRKYLSKQDKKEDQDENLNREQSSKNSSKESPKMSYQETQTYEADFATRV